MGVLLDPCEGGEGLKNQLLEFAVEGLFLCDFLGKDGPVDFEPHLVDGVFDFFLEEAEL